MAGVDSDRAFMRALGSENPGQGPMATIERPPLVARRPHLDHLGISCAGIGPGELAEALAAILAPAGVPSGHSNRASLQLLKGRSWPTLRMLFLIFVKFSSPAKCPISTRNLNVPS